MLAGKSEAGVKEEPTSKSGDYVVGKHIYGNLYGVDEEILGNKPLLEKTLINAAKVSKATILDMKSWVVHGPKGGVSIIVLVDESHLALHTWIEYNYATIDIYTCGEHTEPRNGLRLILETLKPKEYVVHYVIRDSRREEIITGKI